MPQKLVHHSSPDPQKLASKHVVLQSGSGQSSEYQGSSWGWLSLIIQSGLGSAVGHRSTVQSRIGSASGQRSIVQSGAGSACGHAPCQPPGSVQGSAVGAELGNDDGDIGVSDARAATVQQELEELPQIPQKSLLSYFLY